VYFPSGFTLTPHLSYVKSCCDHYPHTIHSSQKVIHQHVAWIPPRPRIRTLVN